MNCKEDKNVNKFTIYFCRMEVTVVQIVVQGSQPHSNGRKKAILPTGRQLTP